MVHSQTFLDLRHDFFRICAFIVFNSLLANFLPAVEQIKTPWLRASYRVFVDLVAGFALNWRVKLPSLDQEWMGFRLTVRHTVRNWQDSRMLRRFR